MKPFLWWFIFTLIGIWAQRFVPGIDFLAPGLVICLQEGLVVTLVQLFVAWILLQEGIGSMSFGMGILWYAAVIFFFALGRQLFETRNLFFIFFIGICMGVWHYLAVHMISSLQDLELWSPKLLQESIQQAVAFTLQWAIVYPLYKKVFPHERTI